MRKTRTAVIMARFVTNCTISSEQIVIKTEVIQVEERGFTERFLFTYRIYPCISRTRVQVDPHFQDQKSDSFHFWLRSKNYIQQNFLKKLMSYF